MKDLLSKTQIDRLGERLRGQGYGEEDLRLLDEYRRSFGAAYDRIVEQVQHTVGVPVSGRPAKATSSIIEKLNRESIRLTQMQDIAGCRVIVASVEEQDRAIAAITTALSDVSVVDRRLKPSHGYRAVHLVVRESGKAIEVQVRTSLQHLWAEMSEKFADVMDPAVKYGGGPANARKMLDATSGTTGTIEALEVRFARDPDAEILLRSIGELRENYITFVQTMIKALNDGRLRIGS